VYVISADEKLISVPIGAVNATYVGRLLSRRFEYPDSLWGESWLVCISIVEGAFQRRCHGMPPRRASLPHM
jgi:hypothetical protein